MRDSSVEILQSYLTSVIESIVGSVDQCPPVMRVAFKQLHKRVEEQFAEPENEVSLDTKAPKKTVVKHLYKSVETFNHECITITAVDIIFYRM